jgi:hypothetical protein
MFTGLRLWMERLSAPRCHSIIDSENFNGYELIEVDGPCRGEIFGVTIRCMKCGAIIEVV